MKVLFAVNNESISQSIIKKYQLMYKEIISWKNVYYFNAIIKELQKDKSYDRIVISEDLEPYSNNNYDLIDKFLFEKLDNISDEASNSTDGDIPIILISTDRRIKSDPLLVKLFGIGIYSVLIGQDRSIDQVCELINVPRTKKEAKIYYNIDTNDVDYKPENEENVPETEIQSILIHYKKLGKNEDAYVASFNDIATQYTNEQLKIIAKYLPLNVKAVLEEKSEKYQEIMMGTTRRPQTSTNNVTKTKKSYEEVKKQPKKDKKTLDMINQELAKSKLTKPVIIPSIVNTENVKRVYSNNANESIQKNTMPNIDNNTVEEYPTLPGFDDILTQNIEQESKIEQNTEEVDQIKRGRGRPKKITDTLVNANQQVQSIEEKRGRGRPKKVDIFASKQEVTDVNNDNNIVDTPIEEPIDLFNMGSNDNQNQNNVQNDNQYAQPIYNEEPSVLPGMEDINNIEPIQNDNIYSNENNQTNNINNGLNSDINNQMEEINTNYNSGNLASLLTANKKIVSFVGTSKNGTSFLVNNIACLLSNNGINTAILDLTKNKNAYYIYTKNDEGLRQKATNCIDGLRRGIADGVPAGKNLTVYTSLPGEDDNLSDYSNILETLVKNYSLVIMDCDFNTNFNYFNEAQEIYLAQSYDILTIQPLTAFLRELKSHNVLNESKLRIVINKALRVKGLTEKVIIGGISSYNDPSMSYMTELFNKDTAIYKTIPFEMQTYSKYLEGIVDCDISLNGYSKELLRALKELSDMVYPLIAQKNSNSKNQYNNYGKEYVQNNNNSQNNNSFGNMNSTLDKMRKKF